MPTPTSPRTSARAWTSTPSSPPGMCRGGDLHCDANHPAPSQLHPPVSPQEDFPVPACDALGFRCRLRVGEFPALPGSLPHMYRLGGSASSVPPGSSIPLPSASTLPCTGKLCPTHMCAHVGVRASSHPCAQFLTYARAGTCSSMYTQELSAWPGSGEGESCGAVMAAGAGAMSRD